MDGPKKDEHLKFFEPPLLEGMKERVGVWYESGMSETYLYACLVEVIEDKMKAGIVYYDPRHDWKLKCDTAVVINNKIIKISAFHGSLDGRNRIEVKRDSVERERKKNTNESAHWGNAQAAQLKELKITRDAENFQEVNGVRLFTIEGVNGLLKELFHFANIPGSAQRFYRDVNGKRVVNP
jgi:hypothetical protein